MDNKKLEQNYKFNVAENIVKESINLINWGLSFSNKTNFANFNQFYTLYFLNTSLGYELLMKSMIFYKNYKDKGNFNINLKKYGHDLIILKDNILKNYQKLPRGRNSQEERMISDLKGDQKFITEDEDLAKILKILSKYGLGGRYYKLDYITSSSVGNQNNLEFEMDKMIIELLDKKDDNLREKFTKAIDVDEKLSNADEVWREVIQKYINPKLEIFLRALARQFAYGRLGEKAMECRGIHVIAYP